MPYSGSFLQTSSKLLCLSQTWLHNKRFECTDGSLLSWSSAHLAASLCNYLLILYKHSAKFKVPLLLLSLHHCDFFYFKWFINNVFQILRPDCHMWTKELFLRYEKDLTGTLMLSNVSYNRLGSPKTHYLWWIFLVFFNCSQTPQWRCWKTYLRHYSCMTS